MADIPVNLREFAGQIERELRSRGHRHCAIYENELQRLWPLDQKDREARISQFAKEHGFRLRFYKKGLCAIASGIVKRGCGGALRKCVQRLVDKSAPAL